MHCTQCSHRLTSIDKFCGRCGHPVSGNVVKGGTPRKPFSNAEGVAGYAALVEAKHQRAIRRWRILTVIYLVVAGFAGLMNSGYRAGGGLHWGAFVITYIIGLIPFTVLGLILTGRNISKEEYEALPGSRRTDGGHQCVHCGHRGIYVKGEYRTNLRYHNCSKCKSYLYTTA